MNSTQKMLRTVIILLVVLIFVIVGLMIYFNINESIKTSKSLKVYINNAKIEVPSELVVQDSISGDVKISIRLMADILGYEFYFGEYLGNNESQSQCYVQNEFDVVAFYKDSKKIYKTPVLELDWGYYNLNDKVQEIDGNLCVNLEGAKIGFNSLFTYNKETNTLNIKTLEDLVKTYNLKVVEWGYQGLESSYNNQKALLNDMLIVKKNDKYGVIAPNGSNVIGVKYDTITYIEDIKEFYVMNLKKVGIISYTGATKINLEYDMVKLLDKDLGLWLVNSNNMYGVLDKNGDIVLYKEFTNIGIDKTIFENDTIKNSLLLLDSVIPVEKNNKWGLYDKTGKQIVSIVCDSIGYVSKIKDSNKENLLLVPEVDGIIIGRNGKYGIVDKEGTVVVSVLYDKIYFETQNGIRKYFLQIGNEVTELQEIIKEREETINNSKSNTVENTVLDIDSSNNITNII